MTDLTPETFDLAAAIAGVNFPEDEVTIYFDESVGYEISKGMAALQIAEIRGNEAELKKLDQEIESLKERTKSIQYRVTVRGIPEATRRACDNKSREKYPVEHSFLGQIVPDADRDEYYNALLWAASITKVTDPSGAVALPTEADVLNLRSSVGRTAVAAIADGIKGLVDGAKAGFERAAQDVDFLSEASPEG